MKFGKKYAEALASPAFPQEWRKSAVEYRKLKKVINKITHELDELGLTSEVLRDLLVTEEDEGHQNGTLASAAAGKAVDEADDEVASLNGLSAKAKGKLPEVNGKTKRKKGRRAKATYELGGTSENPQPRIHLVFESDSGPSSSEDSELVDGLFPLLKTYSSSSEPEWPNGDGRFEEVDDDSLSEAADKPKKASRGSDETGAETDDREEGDAPGEHELDSSKVGGQIQEKLLKAMYGLQVLSAPPSPSAAVEEVALSPRDRVKRSMSVETLKLPTGAMDEDLPAGVKTPRPKRQNGINGLTSNGGSPKLNGSPEVVAEADEGLDGDVADDEGDTLEAADVQSVKAKSSRRRKKHHRPHREVFIPLSSETEFLQMLTHALSSLAALQMVQKSRFAQSVQGLAAEVGGVSSPTRSKSDLYAWREVFGLWIEAQIFESEREKDRGERSVEEVDKRLEWFVDQLAKRKLARKMKSQKSREALEEFIKLNAQLLDLKRFQEANEEAVRKILKKHDKRTSLTAMSDFPQFIAAASDLVPSKSTPNKSSSSFTMPGLPSLPHILLATLTSTLLPVIPSIDDYSCAICGDVAFKPIRLDCGHLFCVRCLVKMQKRAQDACPQCRSPVVLRASAANLDKEMLEYLLTWFPKEVKQKQKDNDKESSREQVQEMGMHDHRGCLVQ